MSLIRRKLAEFVQSPRGQDLVERVRRYAVRPENRRRMEKVRDRIAARRR
jgi:hypothetical protein